MSTYLVLGALATLGGALAGIFAPNFKSRFEKLSTSKSEQKRQQAPRVHAIYVSLTVFSAGFAVMGSILFFFAGAESGDAQAKRAEELLQKSSEEHKRSSVELKEKLHSITSLLGQARREDSEELTKTKLKMIEDDFAIWAEKFTSNNSVRMDEIDKAKQQALKEELAISEQSRPLFLFVVGCLQELLRAYSLKTKDDIQLQSPELPTNFFQPDPAGMNRQIDFSNGTQWIVHIGGSVPAKTDNPPWLKIWVQEKGLANTWLRFRYHPADDKVRVDLEGVLPDPSTKDGILELSAGDYESTVRKLLTKQLEAQILTSRPQARK